MFEESVSSTIPSIWASMYSWFTPAVLFVLLNVMIGTIAITSTLANQKQHHNHHQRQNSQNDPQQPPKLARSPSVLQRLRSINFYNYRSQDPPSSIATHFKTTPDSDQYNFEQTQQPQSLGESHSQYIFEQTHQEKQEALFGQQAQEPQTHYFFQQTHEENEQETGTHFVFQQTYEENAQENGIHFVSQQSHDENTQINGTHFDIEQAHHEENAQENGTHFDFEQAQENVENDEPQGLDEVYSQLKERHVSRSKSDTEPVGGEIPAKLPTKMKKSASVKSAFMHFEEDIVLASRPATVRERGAKVTEVDEEVDAKADDFINRFKQQLKLQRLDSIIRYKEMIGRGRGK